MKLSESLEQDAKVWSLHFKNGAQLYPESASQGSKNFLRGPQGVEKGKQEAWVPTPAQPQVGSLLFCLP